MIKIELMVELAYSLYFAAILTFTLVSFMFLPFLIKHGRSIESHKDKHTKSWFYPLSFLYNTRILKKWYCIFYMVPSVTFAAYYLCCVYFRRPLALYSKDKCLSPLLIHSWRRFTETIIYSKNITSKMTLLQFMHGILYFLVLSTYMAIFRLRVNIYGFLAIQILQSVSHYRVYALKSGELHHYFLEIGIFWHIFCSVRTPSMLFNLLYVCSFVYTSIINRLNLIKKA